MTAPLPGDFAVVSAGGLPGRLVHILQWLAGQGEYSRYQHAFIYTGLPGDHAVIQAEPAGADWAALTPHKLTLWSTGKIPLTGEQRKMIVDSAIARIGTPYSFLDYIALTLHRFHIPVPHLQTYIASTRHEICSAFVDICYQDAEVEIFADKRWNGFVLPAALARRLS